MLALLPQLGIAAADLAAAFLFMYGLHRMSSPVTAPSGIFVAGIGMAVAVLASFLYAFDVGSAARPRPDGQHRPGGRRARAGRRRGLVERTQGGDDRDAADGRDLQRHGRRRGRRHRRGGALRQQGAGHDGARS
jgi:hypothetical protein